MLTFSDIKYTRPDLSALMGEMTSLLEKFTSAKSYDEARAAYLEVDKATEQLSNDYCVANIRFTMNTADEFYRGEMDYFAQNLPTLMPINKKLNEALLASPFRADFEKEYGPQMLRIADSAARTEDDRIMQDSVEENTVENDYSRTAAACTTEFRGEQCNFYGLLKHMQSTDRDERRAAAKAWSALYESVSPTLDEQYSKLVAIRCREAEKLGFKSYVDMAYLSRRRFDYGPEDAARFRSYVLKYITPACQKLYDAQAKRLGIDKLHFYDEGVIYPDGNALPVGGKDELIAAAQQMYRELSPETGEFFDCMVDHELFDLVTRPNKHLGGYTTSLPAYRWPFIFSNFNGTSADVDVLTHEAGHAFEYYESSRTQPISDYYHSTSEINEIHSMSMEHFAYPWMRGFFGDGTDKYLYAHLSEALKTIPYLVTVDEFQHRMYEQPELTAMQRREIWRGIEKKYMPWRDYDGDEFLENGGFWMQKQHIFLYPFYYVDYALAQTCAFQFYRRSIADPKKAFADYLALCRAGGSRGYFELLELSALDNPFKEETVKTVTEFVMNRLDTMEIK